MKSQNSNHQKFIYSANVRYFLIIGVWLLVILNPTNTKAQSVGLSLTPPVSEILLSPNHTASQTFTLTSADSPLTLTPTLHLVKPLDEYGHVALDPSPLSPDQIPLVITSSLPLNQPLTIDHQPLAITLAFEGASLDTPQDIYLALLLQGDSSQADQSTTFTSAGISALILVTLTPVGTLPVNLEIQNFATPVLHDSWTTLTLTPALKNNAPIMVRPEGQFEVIGPTGKLVTSSPLYPNLILGNSTRNIMASDKDPSFATQRTDLQPLPLSWSPKWSDLGPHRLRLTISTQGGTKLTEVEKVVWVLPLRIIALCTLVILLALVWLIRSKNHPQPS